MSVCELVSLEPRAMATRASTTTTRMAAAMSTAAVGSRPKIRRDSPELRGDAETSLLPPPAPGRSPGFTSTLVVEFEVEPAAGGDAGGEACDVALDLESASLESVALESVAFPSSAFGVVADDDEELELLDLSPGAACWVWALDELSDCWAIPAAPSARTMSVLRTATNKHFFMVHLPEWGGATGMPATCGRRA